MNFAAQVKKLVEEAPVVSAGVNVNYGPLKVTPMVIKWGGRGSKPEWKKTLAEYMKENDLSEKDDIELDDGESFQFHFDIDITEINPTLDFHYERDISITESYHHPKDPSKNRLTSWSEIVRPSLEKVFGANWYEKILPNGKKAAPVLYVAAEQADPVEPVKEGKKAYSVPKFLAVYKSLEECKAAHEERYGGKADTEFSAEDFEEEAESIEEESEFSEDVLEQVRDLYGSTRKNAKQTLKMLESDPFGVGEHDPKELFRAALPDVTLK